MLHNLVLHACREKHVTNLIGNIYKSIIVYFFFSKPNRIEASCREGKIPDLSQADTSYYQDHKIQPITKHHVLLLGFTITTHKPIEICQVSCKNQSHLSTCKR